MIDWTKFKVGSSFIAFWVIIFFTGLIVAVIVYNYFHGGLSIDLVEKIGAIWGPWVGTIIGYYFGSRPTESLLANNNNLIESNSKLTDSVGRMSRIRESALEHSHHLGDYIKDLQQYYSANNNPNEISRIINKLEDTKGLLDSSIL